MKRSVAFSARAQIAVRLEVVRPLRAESDSLKLTKSMAAMPQMKPTPNESPSARREADGERRASASGRRAT